MWDIPQAPVQSQRIVHSCVEVLNTNRSCTALATKILSFHRRSQSRLRNLSHIPHADGVISTVRLYTSIEVYLEGSHVTGHIAERVHPIQGVNDRGHS
jgi:hypothetical protein